MRQKLRPALRNSLHRQYGGVRAYLDFSTSNLPQTLNRSREDGWRVLDASEVLFDPEYLNLTNVEVGEGLSTVLVMGSEGRILRTLVAKVCSGFVRIL